MPFRAASDALLTAEMTDGGSGQAIELYNSDMTPVRLTRGISSMTVPIFENSQYLLHLNNQLTDAPARIRLTNPGPPGTFHNGRNPLDVNDDSYVSPLDALLIINDLNRAGGRLLFGTNKSHLFVDVNGDDALSPRDALLVINQLNLANRGEGEFESALELTTAFSGNDTPEWIAAAFTDLIGASPTGLLVSASGPTAEQDDTSWAASGVNLTSTWTGSSEAPSSFSHRSRDRVHALISDLDDDLESLLDILVADLSPRAH